MRVSIENIRARILERPDGYYEDVLSHGQVVGDELELSDDTYLELCRKYEAMPKPEPLPLRQKVANLALATIRAVKYGFPIVSQDEIERRASICEACEFWLEERAIPQCAICGCGDMKHELATEKCPKGKWEAVKKV